MCVSIWDLCTLVTTRRTLANTQRSSSSKVCYSIPVGEGHPAFVAKFLAATYFAWVESTFHYYRAAIKNHSLLTATVSQVSNIYNYIKAFVPCCCSTRCDIANLTNRDDKHRIHLMNDHRSSLFYFDSITMVMARSHEWAGEHIHFRGRYISFSRWFRVALKVVNFKSRKDSPPSWSGQTWSPLYFPKRFLLLAVFFLSFFMDVYRESIRPFLFIIWICPQIYRARPCSLYCYCALDSCLHNRQRTQLWKSNRPRRLGHRFLEIRQCAFPSHGFILLLLLRVPLLHVIATLSR